VPLRRDAVHAQYSPVIENPVTWSRPFSSTATDLKKPLRTAYSEVKAVAAAVQVFAAAQPRAVEHQAVGKVRLERVSPQHGRHSSRRLQLEQVVLHFRDLARRGIGCGIDRRAPPRRDNATMVSLVIVCSVQGEPDAACSSRDAIICNARPWLRGRMAPSLPE